MALPRTRLPVQGGQLTYRVWYLLRDARRAAGLPDDAARVLQGSYNAGRVSASAGTHDAAGAVDLAVDGLSGAQQERLIVELRRRNVCAWIRSPRFGWTSTGPHIHGIVRDEPGLSPGASAQVRSYDIARNGLANNARDPHPRPAQHSIERVMRMDWPVGKQIMDKAAKTYKLKANQWHTVATIDLPKGGRYLCELQTKSPLRMSQPGEAHLGRRGWGTADPGKLDKTGHNPIPVVGVTGERWRNPIAHQITGGGPLEFRVFLPGPEGAVYSFKHVAKALRLS